MDCTDLLQKLIQIPSFSGHEEKLIEFIVAWAKQYGLPAERQEGNIVIRFLGKIRDKALIFSAHLDTVSAGEEKLWKYPPSGEKSGVIENGKIYGLGASDDKAAIAVMLDLARITKPEYDLWFVFVVSEETDGSGTKNFLSRFKKQKYLAKYKKIAVVIGEPTALQQIEIGHRGNAFYLLTACGITCHSAKSYPPKDLAVNKMLGAIKLLSKTCNDWKKIYKDGILGTPSINVTSINTNMTLELLNKSFSCRAHLRQGFGGQACLEISLKNRLVAPSKAESDSATEGVTRLAIYNTELEIENNSLNKIPQKCSATIDIRTTVKLHRQIDKLIAKTLGAEITVERIKSCDSPAVLNSNSQFLILCKKLFPNLKISVSHGSTDLGQFIKAGIEGIVLGPGDYNTAHTIDEYVSITNLKKAASMYKKIIENY